MVPPKVEGTGTGASKDGKFMNVLEIPFVNRNSSTKLSLDYRHGVLTFPRLVNSVFACHPSKVPGLYT